MLLIIVLHRITVWISVLFSLWLQSTFITTLPITFYIIGPNYNLHIPLPSISFSLVPREVNCTFPAAADSWLGKYKWLVMKYFLFSETRLSFITISICIYFRKCVALSTGYLFTKFIVLSSNKIFKMWEFVIYCNCNFNISKKSFAIFDLSGHWNPCM